MEKLQALACSFFFVLGLALGYQLKGVTQRWWAMYQKLANKQGCVAFVMLL
jgi:hypothetical protein